ncbi:MAG: hypothetical protein AAGF88_08585 [Pseudomonadota bacterium]
MTTFSLKSMPTYSVILDQASGNFVVVVADARYSETQDPQSVMEAVGADAAMLLSDLSALVGIEDLGQIYAEGGAEALEDYMSALGPDFGVPEGTHRFHLPDGFEPATEDMVADVLDFGTQSHDRQGARSAPSENPADALARIIDDQTGYMQMSDDEVFEPSSFGDYLKSVGTGALVGGAWGFLAAGPAGALAGGGAGAISSMGLQYLADEAKKAIQKKLSWDRDPDADIATGTGAAPNEPEQSDPLARDPETTMPGEDQSDFDENAFIELGLVRDPLEADPETTMPGDNQDEFVFLPAALFYDPLTPDPETTLPGEAPGDIVVVHHPNGPGTGLGLNGTNFDDTQHGVVDDMTGQVHRPEIDLFGIG